jgi:hypothetical protein
MSCFDREGLWIQVRRELYVMGIITLYIKAKALSRSTNETTRMEDLEAVGN